MAIFHILSTPQSIINAEAALKHASPEDHVLLRADALYILLQRELSSDLSIPCYGLRADAEARGLDPAQYPHIKWIDYAQWVELVTRHQSTVSW